MKFDLFPVVGTMIEMNKSNTKLAINISYRLNCKWDTGLYNMTDYSERNSYCDHNWSL